MKDFKLVKGEYGYEIQHLSGDYECCVKTLTMKEVVQWLNYYKNYYDRDQNRKRDENIKKWSKKNSVKKTISTNDCEWGKGIGFPGWVHCSKPESSGFCPDCCKPVKFVKE